MLLCRRFGCCSCSCACTIAGDVEVDSVVLVLLVILLFIRQLYPKRVRDGLGLQDVDVVSSLRRRFPLQCNLVAGMQDCFAIHLQRSPSLIIQSCWCWRPSSSTSTSTTNGNVGAGRGIADCCSSCRLQPHLMPTAVARRFTGQRTYVRYWIGYIHIHPRKYLVEMECTTSSRNTTTLHCFLLT